MTLAARQRLSRPGALRIALLVPGGEISLPGGASAAQTRTAVLGHVGERIYEAEEHSPIVARRSAGWRATAAFSSAVARRDAAATRAAIVGFFAAHIHVVRVRVARVGGAAARRPRRPLRARARARHAAQRRAASSGAS